MKSYTVKINTNRQLFKEKNMETLGSVEAKNKKKAVDLVYEAFWGKNNNARIDTRMSEYVGPSSKKAMVAEVD